MGNYNLIQKVSMIRKARNVPYSQLKAQIEQNIRECDNVIEQNRRKIAEIRQSQINDERRIADAKREIKNAEKAKKELISIGNKMLAVSQGRPQPAYTKVPKNSFFSKHAKFF